MACLVKAPLGRSKGCITFTTPERDHLLHKSAELRLLVEQLKSRYFIGLHHNWHDHAFAYDPLFDFSMAGDEDLTEVNGKPFPRIAIDACNFAPDYFRLESPRTPFWDVFNVTRAVAFKGIPEFISAVRSLYDSGNKLRVLLLLSVSPNEKLEEIGEIRAHFERLFSPLERHRFTLMTMDWDYPFPLDLETLAFFYRSSRLFVHTAPEERRCRTAAYAWASGIPVVARKNVASILPPSLMSPPQYFNYETADQLPSTILGALQASASNNDPWQRTAAEFQAATSSQRLDDFLRTLALGGGSSSSPVAIKPQALDIRLGRHHRLAVGANRIDQDLTSFCSWALQASDADIAELLLLPDPEVALARTELAPLSSDIAVAQMLPAQKMLDNPAMSASLFKRLFSRRSARAASDKRGA